MKPLIWVNLRCWLFLLVPWLCYLPASSAYFVADDFEVVHLASNPENQPFPAYLQQLFTVPDSPSSRDYRPLSLLILHGIYLWSGEAPLGYRLGQMSWQMLNLLLVYQLFRRLEERGLPGRMAWLAVWLAALHPLQVESVMWISDVVDLMAGAFLLLAAHAFLTYLRTSRWFWLAGTGLAYWMGLLSKEIVLGLPLLLLALMKIEGKLTWRNLFAPGVLYGGLTSLYFALRLQALGGLTGQTTELFQWDWWAFPRQLALLLWPAGSGVPVLPEWPWAFAIGASGLAMLGIGWKHSRTLGTFYLLGFAWIATGILPIYLGKGLSPETWAHRYWYFPSFGAMLMVALILGSLSLQKRALVFLHWASVAILSGLYGLGLWGNIQHWRQAGELARHMQQQLEILRPEFQAPRFPVLLNSPYEHHTAHVFNNRGPLNLVRPPFVPEVFPAPLYPLSNPDIGFYGFQRSLEMFEVVKVFGQRTPVFFNWRHTTQTLERLASPPHLEAFEVQRLGEKWQVYLRLQPNDCQTLWGDCRLMLYHRKNQLHFQEVQSFPLSSQHEYFWEWPALTQVDSTWIAQVHQAGVPVSLFRPFTMETLGAK